MKKFLAAFILLLSFSTHAVNNERTMSFSISPFALIFGGVDALYKIKASDSVAFTVLFKYSYPWLTSKLVGLAAKQGENIKETKKPYNISGGLGARFLLNGKGLNDTFFIEPRVLFGYEQAGLTIDGHKLENAGMKLQPMVQMGWDWYWESGFNMSLGGGFGFAYYFNKNNVTPPELKDNYLIGLLVPAGKNGLVLDLEFKIGCAF